jgi:hypothetical protein
LSQVFDPRDDRSCGLRAESPDRGYVAPADGSRLSRLHGWPSGLDAGVGLNGRWGAGHHRDEQDGSGRGERNGYDLGMGGAVCGGNCRIIHDGKSSNDLHAMTFHQCSAGDRRSGSNRDRAILNRFRRCAPIHQKGGSDHRREIGKIGRCGPGGRNGDRGYLPRRRTAGTAFLGIDSALTLRFIRNFDACD